MTSLLAMTSLYYYRRLVNVVSTLSISTHCLSRSSPSDVPEQGATTTTKWFASRLVSFHRNLFSQQEPDPEPENDRQSEKRPVPNNDDNINSRLPPDIIHQLLANPALRDPLRTPRFPIVLCHGLYGFDSRGPTSFPSMRMHYWSNVLRILRGTVGAEVIVTSVPGTGSITSRAIKLDEQLKTQARGRGINFLAHSMGGLDCRHLISHIQPRAYAPLSLTSISTPHRGSPFMDWCTTNIGIGKLRQQEKDLKEELRRSSRRDLDCFSSSPPPPPPSSSSSDNTTNTTTDSFSLSSLPSLILSIVDSPAYANLTSRYLNDVFNPATPDSPGVKYWSVAGRISAKSVSVWHPFWLPKMVLDGAEETERESLKRDWERERESGGGPSSPPLTPLWADADREWGNDGLVTVQSAKWGEFLGILEGCDHWEMRGARGIEFGVDLPAIPALGLGPSSSATATTLQVQGDGWGFGEWTRFVGAWKKSSNNDDSNGSTDAKTRKEGANTGNNKVSPPPSTDKISMIFDWLIERVPTPTPTPMIGGSSTTTMTTTATTATRILPSSEMKRRMEREDRGREDKRELASREDLERFYVALARKMYDSGL